MQQLREAAEKQKQSFVYDRRWMAADDAQVKAFEAEGRTPTVRLKMPRDGECVIPDLIRGEVRVQWSGEPDHVIQRADGSCLYHLASVVDDHDLGITHVVRAEEHLPNTPRQIFILESLGYQRPIYAHLPYVAEPGGTAQAEQTQVKAVHQESGFCDADGTWPAHRRAGTFADQRRHVQSRDRRLLSRDRLSTRSDLELLAAGGVVARW